ncbi:MAG TPA: methionine--tRNA ligase [Acidimicrobiales bacterium]|jgi:methionyl-tRNA synthetase|nr:methionine--tRNA ligase [Acidimicrobiales bacterium]
MSRYYITTPIYYVNDAPHVGHAYATVNADALARWHRLIGDDVFFLTGTDEHGEKVARAAEEHGMGPQEWTDQLAPRFAAAWAELDISNDDFIRTTEPRHTLAVQEFLGKIYENGWIVKGTYSGLYCVSCEQYYTEDELVNGEFCPVHLTPVELLEEENYFFRLSAFEERLIEWYEKCPDAVIPESKRNEALSFIRGGLRDISITRTSIDWGVPVPWDEKHVFYVWYDALVNYLTAIGYGQDPARFEEWWPAVHHLIGKEIIRFHCVWWPAMCMAAGIDPPAHVQVHGWLLVSGQKMSKSSLNKITPDELIADFGVDPVRYHLLRDTPLGSDGDFSAEGITSRYNADLANNLGNLVSRVATVVGSKSGATGPAPDPGSRLASVAAEVVADATAAWNAGQPHLALEATWRLIRETNAELEATEPWKADPGPAVDAVLGNALEVLRVVSVLIVPAMPATADEIWRRIGLSGSAVEQRLPEAAVWGGYPGGLPVEKGAPLFPRRK